MKARSWLALPLCFMLMLLPGCMDMVELREQSFIVGVGIDQADDDQIELSLIEIQIGRQEAMEAINAPSSTTPMVVHSAKGKNIAECLRILRTQEFKKLTLNKVSYIVFGEAIARKGIGPLKDYLMRSNEIDLAVQLFIANGSAKQLFQSDDGKLLEFTTKGYQYLPTFIPSYLWQLLIGMNTELESTYMNRISINDKKLNIEGEGYMKKDRLKVALTYKESRAINILMDRQCKDILLFIDKEENTSIVIKSVSRQAKYAPDKVHLTYTVVGSIIESDVEQPLQINKQLEATGSQYLQSKLTRILNKTTKEGVDILHLGEIFRQKGWDTQNWEQRIQSLPIEVSVDLHILDAEAMSK